ncbi:MAG: WGR domain-containing protein, partial [Myxococcota bacterium]
MKRIREIALELREGTSDKVYEVDLCEVGPDRFVVNFRFGRRGTRLQEGSKTPLAVARAEADRVFDKLVAEKTDKGYRERTAAPAAAPPPPVPEAPAALPGGDDPRARALVAILAATSGSSDSVVQARKGGWTADPDRLIFRAGELRITEAAAWIARFASRDCGDRRAWNIARALLRCGDPETLPTAAAIAQDPNRPGWVRTLARHAVAALSGGAAAEVTDLEVAAAAGDSAAWLAELSARPERLDDWYLAAADSPNFRAVLGSIPLVGPTFGGVRRVYKAAEAKGDGPVWGLLARRIEQEKCGSGPPASGAGRFAMRFVRARPTGGTRTYLRRRSWRALRRLGEAGLANEYCRMAAGLALAYVDPPPDAEGEAPRRRRRSRASGPWHTSQWALSQVLFSGGPRWSADRKRLRGHRGPALPWAREERFPELWDQCPEILAELLDQSRLAEAHQFAARALKANPAAWPSLPVARLVGWFGAPYPETLALATEVALTRYDPAAPDLELVGALLGCAHAHARTTAEGWIRSNPAPYLASTSFVIGLLLSPRVEARRFALEWLGGATLRPDHARAVVDAVLARVRVVAIDDGVLRDAAAVLVAGFARELSDVPLDTVAELLRHPSAGVAELGAKILLGHRAPATELPDDLLAAAMTSPHVAVRGIGIRRYGELPDSVLAERFRVLVHLVVNPNADVRYAVAPIVVRLAGGTG